MASSTQRSLRLLGVGLDNTDDHKRITRGDGFALVGGSEATHERMTETVLKTCEDLQRQGQRLMDADPQRVVELLQKHSA